MPQICSLFPTRIITIFFISLITPALHAAPTVFPTGTTIYDPELAWNGFTVFISSTNGAVVIDMNGNVVKQWSSYDSPAGGPVRVLPGGYLVGGENLRTPHQEFNQLVQRDWNDNIIWQFDRTEQMENAEGEKFWSARQHHDWQREGFPAGYYSPQSDPVVSGGKTMVLAHQNLINEAVSDRILEDDYIIEVSWEGDIVWQWHASDHIDEFGFTEDARKVIYQAAGFNNARESYDWMHINSATYLGPNRWYDAGDERFHPQNIIISSRQANIVAIIGRDGSIVWRMGPDYRESEEMAELGQVIGQHHPHFIPKGLPGESNLLVFDNGGAGGYGFANPLAPNGNSSLGRGYSRVLEINPVTLELVWSYRMSGQEAFRFYSSYISAAQRLENGNTMITEGADGRLFEINTDGDIVWEYISPYFETRGNTPSNSVYRAYRLPYDWLPQLDQPKERAVVPPNASEFRIAPQ